MRPFFFFFFGWVGSWPFWTSSMRIEDWGGEKHQLSFCSTSCVCMHAWTSHASCVMTVCAEVNPPNSISFLLLFISYKQLNITRAELILSVILVCAVLMLILIERSKKQLRWKAQLLLISLHQTRRRMGTTLAVKYTHVVIALTLHLIVDLSKCSS